MSNDETHPTKWRVKAYFPESPDYRTLFETKTRRLSVPAAFTVQVDRDDDPTMSRVVISVRLNDASRRFLITNLDVMAEPDHGIRLGDLRTLDTASILREAIEPKARTEVTGSRVIDELMAEPPHRSGPYNNVSHELHMSTTASASVTFASLDDPDAHGVVATIYSLAHAIGERPTTAVAKRLGITAGAAAQRVKRARAAGYLPLTTKGKAS